MTKSEQMVVSNSLAEANIGAVIEVNSLKPSLNISEVSKRLDFYDSKWIKINQNGHREITEKNAKELIEKHYPNLLNNITLEELKISLGQYSVQRREEEDKRRNESGWGHYDNETDFILHMNEVHNIFDVKASGTVRILGEKSTLLERLKILAEGYVRETGDKNIKPSNLAHHLDVVIDDMKIDKKNSLKEKISFDRHAPDQFDDLLTALRITENRELNKLAIKHYIWQVKRKLWGYEPGYHFMLILMTNRQAFGKSTFLRDFHLPLTEVFANISGDRIRDQFGAELFEKYYVACFDELAQLNSTDINLLKEFVTRKSSVNRKMFTQVNTINSQNTTLCGTSNRPINQIIYDPSGMRRWWQVDLNAKDFDSMDYDKLNMWKQNEFLDFWKSIDEHDPNGFYGKGLPLYGEMLSHQDSFKAISPMRQFIESMEYTNDYAKLSIENSPKKEIELDHIWERWIGWCKATRNNPYTLQTFKINLEEMGFSIVEHRSLNKTTGQRCRVHFLVIDDLEQEVIS